MTRAEFTADFSKRLANVLQKHERLQLAKLTLSTYGTTPSRENAYAEAENNLVAALDQIGDLLGDAFTQFSNDARSAPGATA